MRVKYFVLSETFLSKAFCNFFIFPRSGRNNTKKKEIEKYKSEIMKEHINRTGDQNKNYVYRFRKQEIKKIEVG